MIDGRAWIEDRYGSTRTARVADFLELVITENEQQNLIAPSTIETVWERHALDSAQLLARAPDQGLWIDIGTGGGFPGMIVALLRDAPVLMVEPRSKRAAFLEQCISVLSLSNASVNAAKIERVSSPLASIITARAVSSMEKLLLAAAHVSHGATRWILPRGRSGSAELNELRQRWRGVFHVEQSIIDPASIIVILDRVSRR